MLQLLGLLVEVVADRSADQRPGAAPMAAPFNPPATAPAPAPMVVRFSGVAQAAKSEPASAITKKLADGRWFSQGHESSSDAPR